MDFSKDINEQVAAVGGQAVIHLSIRSKPCGLDFVPMFNFLPFWPGCTNVVVEGDIIRARKTMKTMLMTACAIALCTNGCSSEPRSQSPRTFADENQDEWLETHCVSKGLIETTTKEFDDVMLGSHANFAELVFYQRCDVRPGWYALDSTERPRDL